MRYHKIHGKGTSKTSADIAPQTTTISMYAYDVSVYVLPKTLLLVIYKI